MRLISFVGSLTFFCLLSGTVTAQNLLNNPESVVYDVTHNRYLVSNFGSGNIVQINEDGIQEYFVEGEDCRLGLHIAGDILFSACREVGVKGFDLQSGELVYFFEIQGARFLNDITADSSGNLYVSDSQGAKIYRINPESGSYTTFVEDNVQNPNGLCFDAPNNRILLCSTRDNSPIQAVSLVDSSVSTVINTTLDILDGFTQDTDGYFYISSWGDNYVYRFATNFSSFERHSQHGADPADIFFDKHNEVLAVPIFYGNTVDFLELPQDVKKVTRNEVATELILCQAYPNPFNSSARVDFTMPIDGAVSLSLYNLNGRMVDEIFNGVKPAGVHSSTVNANDLPAGVYFLKLDHTTGTTTQKIMLTK